MFSSDKLDSLAAPISSLGLTYRSETCLKNENILFMAQLLVVPKSELMRIPNFGIKSFDDVREAVVSRGFTIGCLAEHAHDLRWADANDINSAITKLGIVEEVSQAAVFSEWVKETLPENLKKGLAPEFMHSVLNDPKVRTAVAAVVKGAISEKLGLDGGPQ